MKFNYDRWIHWRRAERLRQAPKCVPLTQENLPAFVEFLGLVNKNLMQSANYAGYERYNRADAPKYLKDRFNILFSPSDALGTNSWVWEHFGTLYLIDEFLLSSHAPNSDVLIRITTDEWQVSFSTSNFMRGVDYVLTGDRVSLPTGWDNWQIYPYHYRVNNAVDFQIHQGDDEFFRDLILLKLSL